jgi:anaerobic magnesium-protoporphyrin IX monomethyl ester cyclase
MMPSYLRDFFGFPRFLLKTYDLYWSSKKKAFTAGARSEEALETSNKIIYDVGTHRNPYYMIKQNR